MPQLLLTACLCAVVAAAVAFPFSAPQGGLEMEARRGQCLDAEAEGLHDALKAKRDVVLAWAAGHASLGEAVDRFKAIEARLPAHRQSFYPEGRGDPGDRGYAQNVAVWFRAYVRNRPDQHAALDRLSYELSVFLGGPAE